MLDALNDAAEIGLLETVSMPVRAFDPFLRPMLRAGVKRAFEAASKATTITEPGHILRLAYLEAHPQKPNVNPNDIQAVASAFGALTARAPKRDAIKVGGYRSTASVASDDVAPESAAPPKRKKRWPVTTAFVALLLVGTAVPIAVKVVPFFIPSPLAKFRQTPLGVALGDPLTDFVLGYGKSGEGKAAKANVVSPAVRTQIGPDAIAALEDTLTRTPEASASEAATPDEALGDLFKSVNKTNQLFSDGNIPALLHVYGEGYPGRRAVWLVSYFVERRTFLSYDNLRFSVAWGRRIDTLNLNDAHAYKGAQEDWAILSLNKIEEQFVEKWLGGLETCGPMGFVQQFKEDDHSAQAELAREAGKRACEEVKKVNFSPSDAASLNRHIEDRNRLAVALRDANFSVMPNSRMEIAPSIVRSLREHIERDSRHKSLVESYLKYNDRIAVYRRSADAAIALIAAVEEEGFVGQLAHEALGKDRPHVPGFRSIDSGKFASALTLLAHAQASPRIALWYVIRRAIDGDRDLRFACESLFEKLGSSNMDSNWVDDEFMVFAKKALETDPAEIRRLAALVYREVLGRAPPTFARR